MLTTVAGGALNNTQPLTRLNITAQQTVAVQMVAEGILKEWNDGYRVAESAADPGELLGSWLGYRLQRQNGGRVQEFLEEDCGLDCGHSAFSFQGKWFPNPFTYATQRSSWPSDHRIMVIKGRTHGDLHGYNVLVQIPGPHHYTYYLIDLASYEDDSHLFFDHAYLELSLLLDYREDLGPGRWLRILDGLTHGEPMTVNSQAVEPTDSGVVSMVGKCRAEIGDWIRKHENGRAAHLEGQSLLGRVAAGLNFVNKRIDGNLRKIAFLYAAANLRQYMHHFNLSWEEKGPVVDFKEPVHVPASDDWRTVWNECDSFDESQNAYVLVVGPAVRELNAEALQVVGRIPWALVLDMDPESKHEGLLGAVRPVLERYRACREMLPDNIQDINYQKATAWLMAGGLLEREDTLPEGFDSWRRQYLQAIRGLANHLRKSVSPRPVLTLFLCDGLGDDYVRALWECLDEVFGEEAGSVAVRGNTTEESTIAQKPGVTSLRCDLGDLLCGLWQIYGMPATPARVSVPARGASDKERKTHFLKEEDLRYLKEDIDVVHRGLADERPGETRLGHDFWRGHQITWGELDMRADVDRDLAERLKRDLIVRLEDWKNASITLYHKPGAGGTTLARRIAWDLKDSYPTVVLHHVSAHSADRIETLFHLTRLPVLAVMEAANVSPPAREQLFKELKGRNARAIFLYVERSINPRGRLCLQDPMSSAEAERFCEKYRTNAVSGRAGVLQRLARDPLLQVYRSPFFFGLYAFEEQFVHVPEYVQAHLAGSSEEARTIVSFLALITRFSQSSLSDSITKELLRLPQKGVLRYDQILGDGPSRLLLHRDQQARVVHPLVAEEILRQLASQGEAKPSDEQWKVGLKDLCCAFIESLTDAAGTDSTGVMEMFQQMFISRDPWQERRDRRRNFSELIVTIAGEAGQHQVLQKLKECCPAEAHFWNHLGRHHMYVMRSTYDQAEKCLQKALELDPDNDVHPHALGMVYRFEIRRRLDDLLRKGAPCDEALEEITELAVLAENCFQEARNLDPETQYGYITNIQLIAEIIARLFRLSKSKHYAEFLSLSNQAASWCREKLPVAEELLRRVKALQAGGRLSRLTVVCDADLLNFYGRFDSMIDSLKGLLQRHDVQQAPVRRTMAHAYYAHRRHDWRNMKARDLRNVHQLMDQNLQEDPTNSRDLLMWFQAYRRLDTFDILDAMDRLSNWAVREDSIDAHYYLYILHFLRWREGILGDSRLIEDHIRKSQTLTRRLGRIWSYECLSNNNPWCPLVHYTELGDWDDHHGFYQNTGALARVEGVIKFIKGSQAGWLALGPFEVFFVPGKDFLAARDEN